MKKLLFLIALLCCYLAQAQTVNPRTLPYEELVDWLEESANTQPDLIRPHIHYILQETEQKGDDRSKIRVYDHLSWFYNMRDQYGLDSVGYYQLLTVQVARRIGDSLLVAKRLQQAGIFLKDSERGNKGQQRIFEALALYEQFEDQAGVAATKRILCDFFRDAKQYKESLAYAKDAIEYYEEQEDDRSADHARLCELTTLYSMEDFEATIALSDHMLEDRASGRIPEVGNIGYVMYHKRSAQLQLGDTLSCYTNWDTTNRSMCEGRSSQC